METISLHFPPNFCPCVRTYTLAGAISLRFLSEGGVQHIKCNRCSAARKTKLLSYVNQVISHIRIVNVVELVFSRVHATLQPALSVGWAVTFYFFS